MLFHTLSSVVGELLISLEKLIYFLDFPRWRDLWVTVFPEACEHTSYWGLEAVSRTCVSWCSLLLLNLCSPSLQSWRSLKVWMLLEAKWISPAVTHTTEVARKYTNFCFLHGRSCGLRWHSLVQCHPGFVAGGGLAGFPFSATKLVSFPLQWCSGISSQAG